MRRGTTTVLLLLTVVLAMCETVRAEVDYELPHKIWASGTRTEVTLKNVADLTKIRLWMRDGGYGPQHIAWESDWAVPAKGGTQKVVLPSTPGYYRLEVLTAGGKGKFEHVAITPTPAYPGHFSPILWGLCTHFPYRPIDDSAYDIIQLANADSIRDDAWWAGVEKVKGQYDFPAEFTHRDQMLAKRGLKQIMLVMGNPLYGDYPTDDVGRQAFATFARTCCTRFPGSVNAIEVWNEPHRGIHPDGFARLLYMTWKAVKLTEPAQPQDVILGGSASVGGGGVDFGFSSLVYQEVIEGKPASEYCTGAAQHPYTRPYDPDLGYYSEYWAKLDRPLINIDSALSNSDYFNSQAKKTGGSYITEYGAPARSEDPSTQQFTSFGKHAAFIARAMIRASAWPRLQSFHVYDLQDDGDNPDEPEHRFGLLCQDLSPKPAFQAYATAAGFLRGLRFWKKQDFGADSPLNAYLYKGPDRTTWAILWVTEVSRNQAIAKKGAIDYINATTTARCEVPVDTDRGRLWDWQGNPLPKTSDGAITVTTWPIYINCGTEEDVVIRPR